MSNVQGFVAVTTAVIVVALLLGVVVLVSQTGFLGRFSTSGLAGFDEGEFTAQGCLDYARLSLARGPYVGDEALAVGGFTCTILPVVDQGGSWLIQAHSSARGSAARLELVIDKTTFATVSSGDF
jgi:hypothetical protein